MATVETVLRDAQALSLDERRHLLEALKTLPVSVSDELQRVREKIAQPIHLEPEDIESVFAMLDRASAEIGSAWTSNMSALEAVQEQRRNL